MELQAVKEAGSRDEGIDEKERENFENLYFSAIGKTRDLLESSLIIPNPTQIEAKMISNKAHVEAKIKLLSLGLPIFSGKYEEWGQFCDTFLAVVGQNINVSDCQPLQYLIAQLRGDAAEALKSLEICAENDEIGFDILRDRYYNKKLAAHNYIRSLFDIKALTRKDSAGLRVLTDTLVKNVRCLEALKLPAAEWSIH